MHRRRLLAALLAAPLALASACAPRRGADEPAGSAGARPGAPRDGESGAVPPVIELIDIDALSPAEQLLAVTLQGLLNREQARVWIRDGGINAMILEQLQREGSRVEAVSSVWELLRRHRGELRGAVVCEMGTSSVNIATSLCGPRQAAAVDASILPRAEAEGLSPVYDARGGDPLRAFEAFKDTFARGLLVEQTEQKPAHLRDFAVQHSAFTYSGLGAADTTRIVREMGPGALVFGWGGDEHAWVQRVSRAGGTGIPADWSRNLSALGRLPVALAARPRPEAAPARDGERIVAFVMSDGDNIQWMGGGFAVSPGFWASPRRGRFNMTWEAPPSLARYAPRVLDTLYRGASDGQHADSFVTGPSGLGYSFHNDLPDRKAFAEQTAEALRASGLSVVSMLNSGGDMSQARELLERPEVAGVLYKDYAPYNARRGAVWWHRGKPAVAYRFLLWEPLSENSPRGVAEAVARMPAAPLSDPGSYALVNVHAWSFKDIGGPMEAVRRTIDLLPAGTRVVTAEQFIALLRRAFGAPSSGGQPPNQPSGGFA
jgi:hypothetical protein